MLKIRSITVHTNPGWPLQSTPLEQAGRFVAAARLAFQAEGYEVQTARLATVPFPHLTGGELAATLALTHAIEQAAAEQGLNYVSLGPALTEFPDSYAAIPAALAETENVFFSGLLDTAATPGSASRISLAGVRACAQVIQQAGPLLPNGFANLRFAALANVPGGSPFFPAAYHAGGPPAFAIATEAAGLAVEAFTGAASVAEAQERLITAVEGHAAVLTRVAESLAAQHGLRFGGIDFSLAPFPGQITSLGEALEQLGVPALGRHGSLAAAAILAEAVDRARFLHAGFSGLMLPVLEDSILAQRAAEGTLTVKDLLLFSAVCGTGLDTVPLPGNVSVEALSAVLLDLAALAHRLAKPLTARLMPVPGKQAGDPTGFDFAFFVNSRVMALESGELSRALAAPGEFALQARRPR